MSKSDRQLWVVQRWAACNPRLEIFELLRETAASYIVKLRDGQKVIRKGTMGTSCFLSECEAVAYLRRIYSDERDMAIRQAQRMSAVLDRNDEVVIEFARGVDDVVFVVECQVKSSSSS